MTNKKIETDVEELRHVHEVITFPGQRTLSKQTHDFIFLRFFLLPVVVFFWCNGVVCVNALRFQ